MSQVTLAPDHYRRNAFRVTGLPVTTTSKAIRRRRRELEVDHTTRSGSVGPELVPAPTSAEINAAFSRLDDPRLRILDELTWVWTEPDGSVPAGADGDAWTRHDRAVRNHARALDLESRTRISAEDGADLEGMWFTAMREWAAVVDDPRVWDRLRARVQELDDERISTGVVTTMRNHFLEGLLIQGASLAIEQAQRGAADVSRHRKHLLELTGGDAGPVDAALRRVVAPLAEEVEKACAASRAQDASTMVAGEDLLKRVKAPLGALAQLLPSSDSVRSRVYDAVATEVRSRVVAAVNAQGGQDCSRAAARQRRADFDRGLVLLSTARRYASDPTLQRKIAEDVTTLQEFREGANSLISTLDEIETGSGPVIRQAFEAALSEPPERREAALKAVGAMIAANARSAAGPRQPVASTGYRQPQSPAGQPMKRVVRPVTPPPTRPAPASAGGAIGSIVFFGVLFAILSMAAGAAAPGGSSRVIVGVLTALYALISLLVVSGAANRGRAGVAAFGALLAIGFTIFDIAALTGGLH